MMLRRKNQLFETISTGLFETYWNLLGFKIRCRNVKGLNKGKKLLSQMSNSLSFFLFMNTFLKTRKYKIHFCRFSFFNIYENVVYKLSWFLNYYVITLEAKLYIQVVIEILNGQIQNIIIYIIKDLFAKNWHLSIKRKQFYLHSVCVLPSDYIRFKKIWKGQKHPLILNTR